MRQLRNWCLVPVLAGLAVATLAALAALQHCINRGREPGVAVICVQCHFSVLAVVSFKPGLLPSVWVLVTILVCSDYVLPRFAGILCAVDHMPGEKPDNLVKLFATTAKSALAAGYKHVRAGAPELLA